MTRRVDVRGLPNVLRREREQLARQARQFTSANVFVQPRALSRYQFAAREWLRVKRDETIELHVDGKPLVQLDAK